MSFLTRDVQLSNLLTRARVSPYFDVERSICLLMESWMQQVAETKRSMERVSGGISHQPLSIAKIFTWPSEEMCACLHKSEEDYLYLFDGAAGEVHKIESSEPMLLPVEHGDRIVILNEWIAKHVTQAELEQILHVHAEAPDYLLQEELCLCATVNARTNEHVSPDLFAVSSLRVCHMGRS
ncbi:MAG: hypothetical protein NTX72_03980 [Candidatus Uhrbacteria bacterium]|nr:hypothetical protein [Candidatus Uhrbacteria bacterium]